MTNLKYLITGTGRSGTVYLSRLLTSLDIPCGHECIFNNKDNFLDRLLYPEKRELSLCSRMNFLNNTEISCWVDPSKTIAESSYLMVPYLNIDELKDIPLIHVVRNPFKVISSFVLDLNYFSPESEIGDEDWQAKIYNFLPELKDIEFQIDRAAYFYCKWNQEISEQKNKRPYFFAQVETIDENGAFFKFLEIEKKSNLFKDKKINSMKKSKYELQLSDIKNKKIRQDFCEIVVDYDYLIKNKVFL